MTAHRDKCGGENSKNVDDEAFDKLRNINQYGTNNPSNPYDNQGFSAALRVTTIEILRDRSVDEGCGRFYYNCPSVPDTEHQEVTCAKDHVYKNADGKGVSKKCGISLENVRVLTN